ncbi:MAG: hypothetical protein QM791_05230 [Ferruginibacter sp.]
MYKVAITGVCMLANFFLFGQSNKIESILKQAEIKKPFYNITASGCKVLYLPMEYGKATFTLNQYVAIQELKNVNIAGIELVYTDYPAKADFTILNRKRLNNLFSIFPGAFNNATAFKKIRQTSATTKEEASYMPHGFYIYYRPEASIETVKSDLKKMGRILKEGIPPPGTELMADSGVQICSEFSFYPDTAGGYIHSLREGFTRTVTKISTAEGIKNKLIDTTIYGNIIDGSDSIYYILDINKDSCHFWDGVYDYTAIDTTVSEILKRHKWNKALIAADVTGSMYPYSAQLLMWLKLTMNDNARRKFIFFNDGDNKMNNEKIIGKTGGLYPVETSKYEDVEKTIELAMSNGCGGDAPENNLEALIKAGEICNSCDSIVMIADNWAPVKDIALLSLLSKPVKIILCGVYGSINTDYLNIARKTKGSIHLIEQDIYELSKMKEGDILEINGRKYTITGGEFKELTAKII